MLKRLSIFIFLTISFLTVKAQKASVTGRIVDTLEKKNLEHSSVLLLRAADSVMVKTTRANASGQFELKNIAKGDYKLLITFPKMADYITNLRLSDTSSINLGDVKMELKSKLLNEVIIQAKSAVRLIGDTLVFQADSFAVRTSANVQELLKRLPGFTIDKNGNIKTQGKDVKTVLVDGDEFFGDDPLLATKYLKANAVEEVQVFDKKSKAAELTGIDDGVKNKTINIKLKENAKNGYLASLDANRGNNNFRDYGAMIGLFKSKLKAAGYGTYSNLTNDSKINRSMRKLKGEDYDVIEVGDDGSSVMYSSGGEDDDDYSSPTSGLPNNFNMGGHFADRFEDNKMGVKLNFKGFDYKNKNIRTSKSEELLPNGSLFSSSGRNEDRSKNTGESLRGSYSYNIDSLSTLKIAFGAKQNRNQLNSTSDDFTKDQRGLFVSTNNQTNTGSGHSEAFNGNINWSRRFNKKGRTLSVDIQPENLSSRNTEKSINKTRYFDDTGQENRVENTNLDKNNRNEQNSIGTRISYTEPLSKRWTLEAGYSFKTISSSSYRLVADNSTNKIDSLSNNFKFINFSNIGKIVTQYKVKNFSISTGLEATQTNFELKDLDQKSDFDRNYLNLAPSTNIFYKINNNSNFSLNYNGYMQQPSINQIQPVRQLNNPLFQIVGNSSLRPSFTNNFGLSYNSFQFSTDQYISGYFSYGFTTNAIVDTEIVDDFNKRISSYTNLNGNNSIAGNVYYSKGFPKLNFRYGIDLGFNTSNNQAILNFTRNKTRNTQFNLRTSLNYYTPKLDISYTPSASFMYGKSSIGSLNDGKSLIHDHEFSATVQLPYKFEFNTSMSLSFRPANSSFDKDLNVAILNGYLATKVLKNEALELKLSITDALNQKIGYNRYVGGNIKSESTFSYIPRYILFGINWNLSGNFIKHSGVK